MKDPAVVTVIVPAVGTVVGALWYALTDPTKQAKALELARGIYWCSLFWLVYVLAHVTVGL